MSLNMKYPELNIWDIPEVAYKVLQFVGGLGSGKTNKTFYNHFTQTPIKVNIHDKCANTFNILNLFKMYKSVLVYFAFPINFMFLGCILSHENVTGFGIVLSPEFNLNQRCISHCMNFPCFQKIKKVILDVTKYNGPLRVLECFPNICELELICDKYNTIPFGVFPTITKLTITNCKKPLSEIYKSFPNVDELNEMYRGGIKMTNHAFMRRGPPKIYDVSVSEKLTCKTHIQSETFNIKTKILELFHDNSDAMFVGCRNLSILPYFSTIEIKSLNAYFDAPMLKTLEIVDTAEITFICSPLEKLIIHCGPFIDMSSICRMIMFYKPKICIAVVYKKAFIPIIGDFFKRNNIVVIFHK